MFSVVISVCLYVCLFMGGGVLRPDPRGGGLRAASSQSLAQPRLSLGFTLQQEE